MSLLDEVDLEIGSDVIQVKADFLNNKRARAMMGTTQAVIQNMVTGVAEGFSRELRLVGVGYRAALPASLRRKWR